MSFIINKRGERVHVDMEADWFSQNCVVYHDDADLFEHWILNLYKSDGSGVKDRDIELVKQVEFRHDPTTDEIMLEMWKAGLSRFDVVTIEKGYRLDWE